MKIDKLINDQAKTFGKMGTLDEMWNRVSDHPKNGVLITMRCGQEDRDLLLQAIMNEWSRQKSIAHDLGSRIRVERVNG